MYIYLIMDNNFEEGNKGRRHTSKWREEKTLSFIRVYRSHPCLWDISLEEYKNRDFRDAAYHDLKERFDLSLHEVKNKIKNLRSTYLQELKKHRESRKLGSNPEGQYEPNLVWFKEMDAMLKGTYEGRPSTSNLINEVIELPADSNFEEILPHLTYQSSDISTNVRRPPKKKWQQIEEIEEIEDTPMIKMESISKNSVKSFPEDEFDLFGRHVAGQLRQMSIVRALKIQTRIQYILYKERMEELQAVDVIQEFSE